MLIVFDVREDNAFAGGGSAALRQKNIPPCLLNTIP